MQEGGREALLDRIVEHLGERGASDLTLRGVAAAIGTSHRMLLYHFGSRRGLLAAVVGEVEARQRRTLRDLADDPELTLGGLAQVMWARLRDPRLRPLERLFFDLYGRALTSDEPVPAQEFVLSWLGPTEQVLRSRGLPPAEARALARLGLAVTRGLLLDLLATGDDAGADAAMDLYARQLDAVEHELRGRRGGPGTARRGGDTP